MKDDLEVQKEILYSLFRTRYIGRKHTPINNLCKRLAKIPCKQIRHNLNSLIKKNFILPILQGMTLILD